ncbi:formyltransferase family protein [Acuticoccus sediminis]|uniref:formyltransferase family protein n=1 Tax=Acuticoccus sediminis TaxID=2184697 RepID=UPI001CFCFC93|nr:formyltransferase family protein [Acuticoccus sediminis]
MCSAAGWGILARPAAPRAEPAASALRVCALTSYGVGLAALRALADLSAANPAELAVVGVATDDALDPGARIGRRKRIWSHLSDTRIEELQADVADVALSCAPWLWTGDVKTAAFRTLLAEAQPDLIVCCCFGQKLDEPLLRTPRLGAVNLHPSDLSAGHGAGYEPHVDAHTRNIDTSIWSAHMMTEAIDAGPVIATSDPVPVRDATGAIPHTPDAYYAMMWPALADFAPRVVSQLREQAPVPA